MNKVLFLFSLFVVLAVAQRDSKITIDPFVPDTATIVLLIGQNGPLPETQTRFTQDAAILGGERDLSLTAESGSNNLVLTAGVSGGLWSVSTPNSARGFALMQYDGVDGDIALRENGLGGVDFTERGGDAFRLLIQSDIDTEYTVTIYTGGVSSSSSFVVPGDDTTNEYILFFDQDFSGGASFTNVGAVEILIEAFDNVDTFVEIFETVGPDVSNSATPTPVVPDVPSASPSPPPGEFTWYTFDDDDNGRSPCGDEEPRRTYFVADDNIVYYYFYGFEEPILESTSAASLLQLSAGLLFAVFALF